MARDFLNRANENVGIDQKIWLISETGGFGNDATGGLIPTATDAIEHVNAMLDFKIPREDAAHRSGRSTVVRLSGKKEVKFTFESYIVPTDPNGSDEPQLPDMHPLLLNVFGLVDQSSPTEIVYNLARASSKSFRILEEGTHFSRLAVGCFVDSVTFTLPGDGMAMVKFEGLGQDLYAAGQTTVAANTVASNDVTVPTGHGSRFEVNSYIDVIQASDGDTRVIASRKLTAIVGDTLTFNGAAASLTLGDIIVGAAPDFTAQSSEDALLGLKGTFSTTGFGTLDCQLISAEIGLKNNFTPKNFIYGTDSLCGYIADKRREVTIKLDVLLTQDNYDFYMNNKKFLADDLDITLEPQVIPGPINSALGRRFKFHFDKVEFDVPTIEQPGDSYVKITLEGKALAADINSVNNEFSLTIY